MLNQRMGPAFAMTPRNKRARASVLLCALVLPSFGLCQSPRYEDADNPSEAVGMMRVVIQVTETLRDRCTRHDAALQERIDADLLKWRTTEQRVLERTMYYWNRMAAREPTITEALAHAERTIDETLRTVSENLESSGRDGIREYCIQHFSDLASGIWRERTPKAYAYMDEAP